MDSPLCPPDNVGLMMHIAQDITDTWFREAQLRRSHNSPLRLYQCKHSGKYDRRRRRQTSTSDLFSMSTSSDVIRQGGKAPVNEVSAEILAQIFEAGMQWKPPGLSPHNCCAPYREALDGYAPMVYLKVCKYWREVALSTSSLWTRISSSEFRFQKAAAMKFWLDQSSPTAPLNLQLRDCNLPSYTDRIFRTFTTQVKRWRSMSIDLDLSLAPKFAVLLEERIQDLDGLEELEIRLFPKDVPVTVSQRIFTQIPFLKSLRSFSWIVHGYRNTDHAFRYPSALAALDEITVYNAYPLDECIVHLSQCVSATTVRLYDSDRYGYIQTKPTLPITSLPHLTSLTLCRYIDPIDVLDYFTLPSLNYLKIIASHPSAHNLILLESFLARSKCSLKTFVIEGGSMLDGMSDNNLVDYLLFLPIHSIPEVEIHCCDITKRMLKILQTYPNAEAIFPSIISWRPNTFGASRCIGWTKLAGDEDLYYSWKAGKLDFRRWPDDYDP